MARCYRGWVVGPGRLVLERILPLAVLALALVAVPVMMFSRSGFPRLNALRQERSQAQLQISRLSQRIRELRAAVERARQDPEAVERVARDQLGLVRQTEVVFQFD